MSSRVPILAGIAALSFFAGITGVRLAYTLTYVLLALLVAAFIWTRAIARRIEVQRESPRGSYGVGEPFSERFTVHNRSALWVPYCEVHDHSDLAGYAAGRACALGAGDSVSWSTRGAFLHRGRQRFGPLEARVGDPFGLFTRTVKVAARTEVTVYPAIHPLDDIAPLWSGTGGGDLRRGKPVDVPPEVSSVRDYDSADGMNRIHWASTARTGRLMSRTYDTRQSADLLIILDLRSRIHAGVAPESTLEYAVSIAASILHAATRRGQAVGLITNDAEMQGFGAGRGDAQRLRLLSYLATATDNGTTPLAPVVARHGDGWRGRGGMVVITADRDSAWVEALVDAGTRGQRHLAVFVEPTSFGARGPAVRIPAAWRLALDWWLVRRGDVLGIADRARAARG